MSLRRTPASSFEAKYRESRDPWSFGTSPYEQRRYAVALAMLPAPHYTRAFEPGCSIGELTARLAARCDQILAMDCSPTAVAAAQARCRHLPGVRVVLGEVPEAWPVGAFDLVVLSEIGYYLAEVDLRILAARAAMSLGSGGALLAVHWRGHSPDHVLHGDRVHAVIRVVAPASGLRRAGRYLEDDFRADAWTRGA